MSGTGDAAADGGATAPLHLAAGDQVLALHGDPAAVFDALPDRAFEDLVVVGSRVRPDGLASVVEDRGGDPATVTLVPVGVARGGYDGPVRTTRTVTPSDLTGLSIRVGSMLDDLERAERWVVFDTLGVLLVYASRDRLARFLHWLTTALRKRGVRGVYGLQEDSTTDETTRMLAQMVDRTATLG